MTKTALVTGATGGLGQAIATKLTAQGYRLILVDFDAARLADMAQQHPGAVTHVLDQRDSAAVAHFCDTVIEQGPFVDVALVNAGMLVIGSVSEISRQAMLDQLQVNLIAGALMIQSFARRMSRVRKGHILATVSMGGIVSLKGSATYSASKFGLRGLLWGLRDELSSHGVHVTGIYPAGIDTPMLRHEARHGGSALNFVGDPVTVDDVVNAIMAAIQKPRLEVYVPFSEGITGRIAGAWPGLLAKLYPTLEPIGEKGRAKFLRRIGEA
jgi:short-subunit dehydrogenase